MAVSRLFKQFQRNFWMGFEPYWMKLIPEGKPWDYNDIPVVGPNVEEYKTFKIHEAYARWYKEHGNVVREVFQSGDSCVHLYHEDDFRIVFAWEVSPQRRSHQVIARYRRDRPDIFPSVGLGASLGKEWQNSRKIVPDMRKTYNTLNKEMEGVTDELVHVLKSESDKNGEIDLLPWLYRWAYESFGVLALNKRLNALSKHGMEEADLMIKAAENINKLIFLTTCHVGDFEEHYKQLVPILDYYCSTISRQVNEVAPDQEVCLLKQMMDRAGMRDVLTVLQDLFLGAMHTTAITTGVALYHVARHPTIQKETREELTQFLPEKDSSFLVIPRYGEVIQSLRSIVVETLRLNPPTIGFGRVTNEDTILGGYLVPKGTMIVVQTQVASRMEQNFGKPMEFLPERHTHLKGSLNRNMRAPTPFGWGARFCPGKGFATYQMNMSIAKILRNFEISYHHEEIDFINQLHNVPDRPIKLRLKPLDN